MSTRENEVVTAAAVAAQGEPAGVSWGDPSKHRILGKRFPRHEGPDKVTGRAIYSYDVVLPGMLYGRIVRCPYASARIESPNDIDDTAVLKIPGVKAVLKMVPAGGLNVRFAGQEVAAIAATSPEIAADAVRALERRIKYKTQPFVVNEDKASQPDAPRVRPEGPNVVPMGEGKPNEKGDVDAAFKEADAISEGVYEAQTRLHCCLETHGHVCKWDGDRLTVWASTQNVSGMRGDFRRFDPNTRIICEHMGGGFGSKFGAGPEGLACAELAKMAGAPVKLMLIREDEQVVGYRSPGVRSQIKLGAKKDGTLVASEMRSSGYGGISMNANTPLSSGAYIIEAPARRSWYETILTNGSSGTAALRAPGHPQASWCWEAALDDMAAKIGMDPLEFRRKNHSDPVRTAEWTRGAELIGWSRRPKTPGAGTGVLRRGIGMASATWGGGGSPGSIVDVEIGQDGTIHAKCGTQDIGTGTRTYIAAILAEDLGLELGDVVVHIGDNNHPPGAASGGSQTVGSVAPAAKMAAVDVTRKLLPLVARHEKLGVAPEEAVQKLEFTAPGKIQVKGEPAKSITWKQACAMLPPGGLKARGELTRETHAMLARGGVAGCCFAEVEVDTETGKVRVVKIVSVQDAGFIVNRMQSESQVYGGIIQGIAQALLEERQMDNLTGRMLNPNLEEYKLTHAQEVPEIVVELFDVKTGRVSGIGEPCVIPVASAIGNAVFNAIGVRVGACPMSPDRVLEALAKRQGVTA